MTMGMRNVLVTSVGSTPLLPRAHPKTATTRPTAFRPPGPARPAPLLPFVTNPSVRLRANISSDKPISRRVSSLITSCCAVCPAALPLGA